jgi:hypothetical protein
MITGFMMVKKSENKQNIIEWIFLSVMLFACYNGIVAVLYTAVRLPIDLFTLMFANLAVGVCMIIQVIKSGERQKYKLFPADLVIMAVLAAICVSVFVRDFGGTAFNIRYETADPAVHFAFAEQFYEHSQLSIKEITLPALVTDGTRGTAGPLLNYVNVGITFKFCDGLVNRLCFYKIFILTDIVKLFFCGLAFYYCVRRYLGNKLGMYIFALPALAYYLLGYPLNAVVFGFPELLMCIIMICGVIISGQKLFDAKIRKPFAYSMLAIFATGVFFAYHLLIPPVLLGMGISLLLYSVDLKKLRFTKSAKEIAGIVVTLAAPALLGLFYLFVLPDSSSVINTRSALSMEGYIYRDLFSNFIIMSVFALYGLLKSIRMRKFAFENTLFITSLLYYAGFFYLAFRGKMASYYFEKLYYLGWLMFALMCIIGCSYLYNEHKEAVISFALCVSVVFLLYKTDFEKTIAKANVNLCPQVKSTALIDIFTFNDFRLDHGTDVINKDEMEIVDYVYKNKSQFQDNKGRIAFYGMKYQTLWIYTTTQMWLRYSDINTVQYVLTHDETNDFRQWEADPESKYLVCFTKTMKESMTKNNIDLSGYKVIYQNEAGAVVSK